MTGLFSGVSKVAGPLLDKAGSVVDKYWKNEYHNPSLKRKGEKKGDKNENAMRNDRRRQPATEETRSAEMLESALGPGEEEDSTDSDLESSVASLSSEDSDVQELSSPLLPAWLQPRKFRKLLAKRVVSVTHDLATSTLTSAEWILEMTGYGVTVMGQMVWVRVNAVMKNFVEEHYTLGHDITLEDGTKVRAPRGASTHAYIVPVPPTSMPPSACKESKENEGGESKEALPSPSNEVEDA